MIPHGVQRYQDIVSEFPQRELERCPSQLVQSQYLSYKL